MRIIQSIKDSPVASSVSIGSLLTLLGVIISGWLFVDGRYVHATEFKTYETRQVVQINGMRKFMVENDLFRAELIPVEKRSDVDRAMIKRHERQLTEINEANRLGRAVN